MRLCKFDGSGFAPPVNSALNLKLANLGGFLALLPAFCAQDGKIDLPQRSKTIPKEARSPHSKCSKRAQSKFTHTPDLSLRQLLF